MTDVPRTKEELIAFMLDRAEWKSTLEDTRKLLSRLLPMLEGATPTNRDWREARRILDRIKFNLDVPDADKIRMKRLGLERSLGNWTPPTED